MRGDVLGWDSPRREALSLLADRRIALKRETRMPDPSWCLT
jgi:hypothetical protein